MALKDLTPWRAGQSGNPLGRPKVPESLRAIKALSHVEAGRLIAKYARFTLEQLELASKDPQTPVVELAIAAVFAGSIKYGDFTRLSFLLDRACGKIPNADVLDEDRVIREELAQMSEEELLRLVRERFPQLAAG